MTEAADPKPTKKGLGPLAWVGIGCAGMVLLGIIVVFAAGLFVAKKVKDVAGDFEANPAMVAAEWIVKATPELELVSKDDENGRLTVKNTKTGEVVTVDVEDIREGKISFLTDEGEVDLEMDADQGRLKITGGEMTTEIGKSAGDDLPDWLPAYPGGKAEGGQATTGPGGRTGTVSIVTDDPPDEILAFYREAFDELGFNVQTTTVTAPGGGGMLIATSSDGKRTAHVVSSREDERTQLGVTYSEQD